MSDDVIGYDCEEVEVVVSELTGCDGLKGLKGKRETISWNPPTFC